MLRAMSDTAPTPDPGAEHRRHERAPVRLRVDYQQMNQFFADYTANISKGGTFIKTRRPLPAGTEFLFALAVPALTDPILLKGEVQWVTTAEAADRDQSDAGMGVKFVFLDEAARTEFEGLVERLMVESLGADAAQQLLQK
jgi:type IV pilus assembly protein PilZ